MPITASNPFKGRQYPGEVIVFVRAMVSSLPLSYEHVSELLEERGFGSDPSCIWRWVQAYAPELNKRCRPFLKPANKSYRIDETYIKVKGQNKYLCIERWIRQVRPSSFCSPRSATRLPPNVFWSRRSKHRVIRCHG